MRLKWFLWILLMMTVPAMAQETTCLLTQQATIAEAGGWCQGLSTGEMCYGDGGLQVLDTDGTALPAGAAGDRLRLSELSLVSSQIRETAWGMALLQTQALGATSGSPQMLAFAILGAATLTNDAPEQAAYLYAPITPEQGANLRSGPGEQYRQLGAIAQNESVLLTGRSADGLWLRMQRADGSAGWLVASAVLADTSELPTVTVDDPAPDLYYAPFAAFSVHVDDESVSCAGGVPSGVLVQNVHATDAASIQLNGVRLQFDGALFLTQRGTDESTRLVVNVIAGEVDLMPIEGEAVPVEAAQFVELYTDEDGIVQVSDPAAYDYETLVVLPLSVLPQPMYVAVELTQYITPAPSEDRSPIADMLATDPCRITTGPGGANLRYGPGRDYAIRGVMQMRESADVQGRAVGTDGASWWQIAPYIWISAFTTVTGGDCVSVPMAAVPAAPQPTATPE